MQRQDVYKWALTTLGLASAAVIGYFSGNPDAREEAARIFSGGSRAAVVRQDSMPSQAVKQGSYKKLAPKEMEQYKKYMPQGVEITHGIAANDKVYLLGKEDFNGSWFTGLVFVLEDGRLQTLGKEEHLAQWNIIQITDYDRDGFPEIITTAYPDVATGGIEYAFVYDGKTKKRTDLTAYSIEVIDINSNSGPKFVKTTRILGPGTSMAEQRNNATYEYTVYGYKDGRFVEDPQLTAKFRNAQQQLTSIASSNDSKRQQQMKSVVDKEREIGYAAMASLYPEMSDYFKVAADVQAGRLTPLEASLYLGLMSSLPPVLSPEALALYGVQRFAQHYDDLKRQEADAKARSSGITSGSQPQRDPVMGTYDVYADGQRYSFPTKQEAENFITKSQNERREYQFEKVDPRTGQTNVERYAGTPQEYQRERERRALEEGNRRAAEDIRRAQDAVNEAARKASESINQTGKGVKEGIDKYLGGSGQSSGSSGASRPPPPSINIPNIPNIFSGKK